MCKTTKDLAHSYLWTPKKGHQGNWTLEIMPGRRDDKSLQAFLQMKLPPPSRLHIKNLKFKPWPRGKRVNFFDDANLEEFMRIYSKYVTHLKISHMEIPFTSAKEIGFYESLVKLESLENYAITTGGTNKFNLKIQNEGSCLTPSTFKKVKCFKAGAVDCTRSFATFVHGLKCLERISGYRVDDIFSAAGGFLSSNGIAFLRSLIEQDVDNKLKFIDWMAPDWPWNPMEVLQLFALCSDKGIKIQRLPLSFLEVLFCNDNGIMDKTKIFDEESREYVYRVNYQRNSFVGNVFHSSMYCIYETVFLTELPYLEELKIYHHKTINSQFNGLARSFKNLKKLTLQDCAGSSQFYVPLWEGLLLLEHVELVSCRKLGDEEFIGNSKRKGAEPVFLKLESK